MSIKQLKTFIVNNRFAMLLVVCGIIGLFASAILTVEKVRLANNPAAQLSCNLNPIVSCGSVMKTSEAALFGFANSIIGIPAYAAIILIGVALMSGKQFKRWTWLGVQSGAIFGIVFTHWLFYQSVYRINALCPYCMVVWVVTMLIFWYVLLFNLRSGHLSLRRERVHDFLYNHHFDLFMLWALGIGSLILNHFWYYFKTVI